VPPPPIIGPPSLGLARDLPSNKNCLYIMRFRAILNFLEQYPIKWTHLTGFTCSKNQ
jgi:hypothetical protein